MGLKSGERAGQSITCTLLAARYCLVAFAEWLVALSRWVCRQESVGPATPFFASGGPQTGNWSTKTTKDGKCLSVIVMLVENQYGLS